MHNRNNLWILTLLGLLLFQLSCTHDPFEPQVVPIPNDSLVIDERCIDYDSLLMDCVVGPFYNDLSPAFKFPAINPNNPMEFAYYVDKKVYKYDMVSNTKTLLAENIWVIERMDWGAQGWITFSTYSPAKWKVWLLKDDGTELKQLTFGERDLGPQFNYNGEQLIYGETQPLSESRLFIINLEGLKLDSFCRTKGTDCYSWDFCSWSKDEKLFAAPNNGITIYDLEGKPTQTPFKAGQDVADIPDIEWLSDNENILFITTYGNNFGTIYKVNVNTEEVTMIKEGCENRFYTNLTISPDGDFMLVQKGTANVDGCDVNITWRIVKMDLNGENEEIISLPND